MHIPAIPTYENCWSSYFCEDDGTHCASDNPCDCCMDSWYEEMEIRD